MGTKRRRTTQEIKDQKEEAQLKEEETNAKLSQVEELMRRCQELEDRAKNNEAASTILTEMIGQGKAIMDDNGNVSIPQEGSQMGRDENSGAMQFQQQDDQNDMMGDYPTP